MRNISNTNHTIAVAENKRIVVSFRIDKQLWLELDGDLTEKYGNYKKSAFLEHLIKKYLDNKKNINK